MWASKKMWASLTPGSHFFRGSKPSRLRAGLNKKYFGSLGPWCHDPTRGLGVWPEPVLTTNYGSWPKKSIKTCEVSVSFFLHYIPQCRQVPLSRRVGVVSVSCKRLSHRWYLTWPHSIHTAIWGHTDSYVLCEIRTASRGSNGPSSRLIIRLTFSCG